jgi:hypothetical protein
MSTAQRQKELLEKKKKLEEYRRQKEGKVMMVDFHFINLIENIFFLFKMNCI